ncbi:MAG: DEAD/DEAH box helicase [Planctomycetes bacterium]|nr:DEAD/DEAH box helicase [Planctomycetota bacterium]
MTPDPTHLDAVYLHARLPADARIAFYSAAGCDAARALIAPHFGDVLRDVELEMVLPTEESTLRPVLREPSPQSASSERIVPGMWRLPAVGLPLRDALPWLAEHRPALPRPGLVFLTHAARLARGMIARGDFAPADAKSFLDYVPVWSERALRGLGAIAELVPGFARTARFATQDDPVWAVSARTLAFRVVAHGIDALAPLGSPGHASAERLPDSFTRPRAEPLVEILAPERELEEGAPWAIQLLFRPVPGVDLRYPLEALEERIERDPLGDPLMRETLDELRRHLESVAAKIPAIHRAMNMADGRASLNREERDQVLDHLPLLEDEGFQITVPGVESMQRLSARVSLVERAEVDGLRPWFDFRWSLAVGDQQLDDKDFQALVDARSPLVFLERGPVLLTPKDRDAVEQFKKRIGQQGDRISFFEALRLKLGGATHLHGLAMETLDAGPRLEELVQKLDSSRRVEDRPLPPGFVGELRPYQTRGHAWLHFLIDQGFGACLADDMGLGKTVQAIAVILDWRNQHAEAGAVLLVCPVSVLGNWRRELHRFAPGLRVELFHGKLRPRKPEEFAAVIRQTDVVLTSFNLLQRDQDLFMSLVWEGVILDEAQNIKNPSTRQSKAARQLSGRFRLALTGTPLENRPLDLWSIMDFLNEGLLGNRTQFLQTLEHPIVRQRSRSKASTLGRLVRPFVLRRLKTDPDIVSDLPEKSEQVVAANLSREQAVLYEAVVRKGLVEVEKAAEGMQRRGAILTTLLRLKQVCNHPAHYQGDGSALADRSGKLDLLTEMLQEALDEGDRCLIFTQFKEMGSLLKTHLEEVFGAAVLFLHGGVPQRDREDMVARFQASEPDGPRIFVLSLKAGGTGLNLTAANRVFHFDRWWNPAVEDQATDRAFRIGQKRNVFVHKFVCIGTLEERIQTMLEQKRDVANTLLGAGENWLTELSNDELRRLLVLDRKEALA